MPKFLTDLVGWITSRGKEASTWLGVAFYLKDIGINLPSAELSQLGVAVVAFLAVLFKDKAH